MKFSFLHLLAFLIGFSSYAQIYSVDHPAIIPRPRQLEWKAGKFKIPKHSQVFYSSGAEASAEWMQQLLKNTSASVEVKQSEHRGDFNLRLDPTLLKEIGKEGYKLKIDSKGVLILAATDTGLFYGIQTLRQMFPAEIEKQKIHGKIKLQKVTIADSPEYEWRGSMLDIARSFFGVDYLKKHIDRMAMYKLNRLHLHLTDDQGWRIEIKGWPKLAEIGGKSAVKYGRSGFLSQKQYKELQEYAEARHIIIIPEVDMPGHIYAALMAYPELNCEGFSNLKPQMAAPPQMFQGYKVGWSRLCLEKPETYQFVSDVIEELSQITNGPWIHIGGDEIDDPRYEEFVVKADSIVKHFGKTSIGWEEVTKAPVSSSLISQKWNGRTKSMVDVKIIESMCSNFYFDHANVPGQEHTNNWCKKNGVSLKDAYNYKTDNPNIIGVEAPVWTELVTSNAAADNRLWPRSAAMAEAGWTPYEIRNFNDFTRRIGQHSERLENLKIDYYRSPEVQWATQDDKGIFSGFIPENKKNISKEEHGK